MNARMNDNHQTEHAKRRIGQRLSDVDEMKKPLAQSTSSVSYSNRGLLQRLASIQAEPYSVPPIVYEALRSPGQPLAPITRAFMEPRFGYDFSSVRVHADQEAAASTRLLAAKAYTIGRDIVFGPGLYSPDTSKGQKLLAHELAHVIQQSRGGPAPKLQSDAVHEHAAHEAADAIATGWPLVMVRGGTGVGLARQTDDPEWDWEWEGEQAWEQPVQAGHLERGYYGEQGVGFQLYRYEDGWAVVRGPSGAGGHMSNAPGEDGLFFNVRTRELHIVDNRASATTKNIGSATAIDPEKNLLQNLDDMIRHVEGMSLRELPMRQRVLSLLRKTRAAIRSGGRLPARVRLIVTNVAGRPTNVTKRLRNAGVEFVRANRPVVPRPGTARPPLASRPAVAPHARKTPELPSPTQTGESLESATSTERGRAVQTPPRSQRRVPRLKGKLHNIKITGKGALGAFIFGLIEGYLRGKIVELQLEQEINRELEAQQAKFEALLEQAPVGPPPYYAPQITIYANISVTIMTPTRYSLMGEEEEGFSMVDVSVTLDTKGIEESKKHEFEYLKHWGFIVGDMKTDKFTYPVQIYPQSGLPPTQFTPEEEEQQQARIKAREELVPGAFAAWEGHSLIKIVENTHWSSNEERLQFIADYIRYARQRPDRRALYVEAFNAYAKELWTARIYLEEFY